MAKYHLTDNGAKVCFAQPGNCKYKAEDADHFNNFTEAQTVYESRNRSHMNESLLGLTKNSDEKSLLKRSLEFLKGNENEIVIPNKSGEGESFVKLSNLQDGKIAGNNCYGATVAINDILKSRGFEPEKVQIVMNDGSVHYANKVDDTIVDYSFRQFDEHSEFPMVMKKEEWLNQLDSAVFKKFGLKVKHENI